VILGVSHLDQQSPPKSALRICPTKQQVKATNCPISLVFAVTIATEFPVLAVQHSGNEEKFWPLLSLVSALMIDAVMELRSEGERPR
jgi:hypothetical protein